MVEKRPRPVTRPPHSPKFCQNGIIVRTHAHARLPKLGNVVAALRERGRGLSILLDVGHACGDILYNESTVRTTGRYEEEVGMRDGVPYGVHRG